VGRLAHALTHSSYGNYHDVPHNERLEFLGDSVLDLATADWLMYRHPNQSEGFMSKRRAELVQATTLTGHARRLGIDRAIRVGPKAEYLRNVDSVLADALEAIVGALYKDCNRDLGLVTRWLREWGVLV
jgi:ribonuclease-3